MADPRLRQIVIKTGVLKRLTKEKSVYEREIDQQKNRIEKLRADGKDMYVLKKEDEVLQEAMMMVPDSHRRLTKAYADLQEYIESEVELKETKEYEAAVEILSQAREKIEES